MKRLILAVFLVFCLATTALADAFQFRRTSGALAVEAAVYFGGKLVGYTNIQGILFVTSPQGTNTFSVAYMGKTTQVILSITGNPQLKVVYIE